MVDMLIIYGKQLFIFWVLSNHSIYRFVIFISFFLYINNLILLESTERRNPNTQEIYMKHQTREKKKSTNPKALGN
jgi:hypothetical protein